MKNEPEIAHLSKKIETNNALIRELVAKTEAKGDGFFWRPFLCEKIGAALVTGFILALVAYLFAGWQEDAKRRDFYFQEKLKTFTRVASQGTGLLNDLNTLVQLNTDAEPANATAVKAEKQRMLGKIDGELSELSTGMIQAKIYFSDPIRKKTAELHDLIMKHYDTEITNMIQPNAPVMQAALDWARLAGEELTNEFHKILPR
jgi:hypothetical protein